MIEGDGLFVFLQSPQETGVFLLHGVFQKLCADAAALEDRLHEELFDFTIGDPEEALDHAVIVDQQLVKMFPIGHDAVCYLESSRKIG